VRGTQKVPAPLGNSYEANTPEKSDSSIYVPFLLDFVDLDL
jgi:hypothetical protein